MTAPRAAALAGGQPPPPPPIGSQWVQTPRHGDPIADRIATAILIGTPMPGTIRGRSPSPPSEPTSRCTADFERRLAMILPRSLRHSLSRSPARRLAGCARGCVG
jgi:hypothetical protein